MPQIAATLSGVSLVSVARTQKNGTLKYRANLTKEFSRKMQWGELTAGQTGVDMEGTIVDGSLIMTAEQKDLFADGEFRVKVQFVDGFKIHRMELKGKKGKGFRFVLDFEARFVEAGIAALGEAWIVAVGQGVGTMTVKGMLAETVPEGKDGQEEPPLRGEAAERHKALQGNKAAN